MQKKTLYGRKGERVTGWQWPEEALCLSSSKQGITVLGEITAEMIRGEVQRQIGNEAQSVAQ